MPIYEYNCPEHGAFERRAGYEDSQQPCGCGLLSSRRAVYPLSFKIEGKSMPRRDDVVSTQEEMHKELRKRGWSADRAIEELRANKFEDETGSLRIDTRKMTQAA